MKALLTITMLASVAAGTLPAKQFEGAISMKATTIVDSSQRDVVYSILIKKNLMAARVEKSGDGNEGSSFIMRGDKKVMWIVDDEKKQYMEISLDDQHGKEKKGDKPGAAKKTAKIKQSGKKQSILGYACEEWLADDGDETTTIWATGKLGDVFAGLTGAFSKMGMKEEDEEEWQGELVRRKLFPLKIETRRDGVTTEIQEVTKIEHKSVPSSTFDPPAGYERQSLDDQLQEMMKTMQGRGKGTGKDSSDGIPDLEKMMKQMQEQLEEGDSTKGNK